jgi:hypothetical protein
MLCNFSECHVVRSLIHDNRSSWAILFGSTSTGTVLRSRIQDNLGTGIAIFDSDVTIAHSRITGNGHFEFFEDEFGSGVLVWETPDAEIPGRAEILRNVITDNARDGVEIADTATPSVVANDHADRNGDDGLDVDAPGSVVTGNRAFFNGDFGIEAIAGTVDGGGNKAKHNGNPAQCVEVSCK